MNFDFALILVGATFVSGLVWLLDSIFFAPKRKAKTVSLNAGVADGNRAVDVRIENDEEPWLVEYARSFFPVLLIVLTLRSFIFEPFRIPSGSMIPTLWIGDFILVNKFQYGVRLPVLHTKILDFGEPERGDVAVFRFPQNPALDYIKRVIGLPGDHIKYVNKSVFVNGQSVKLRQVGPYQPGEDTSAQNLLELNEDLLGVKHNILITPGRRGLQGEGEWVVPEGHYFVMGDNRDNSNDSRYWGFVPEENLVGKALLVWMHWNWDNGGLQWERIGKSID